MTPRRETGGAAGAARADYGRRLIQSLSERLTAEFGKGFHARNLWWMRNFYTQFPILNALRSELSWTHYRLCLPTEEELAAELIREQAALSQRTADPDDDEPSAP